MSLVDDGEGRPQKGLHATNVAHHLLLLGDCVTKNLSRLGVGLRHDHVGFPPRGLLQILGGALGRYEGRAQKALELDVTRHLRFELLDTLDEL